MFALISRGSPSNSSGVKVRAKCRQQAIDVAIDFERRVDAEQASDFRNAHLVLESQAKKKPVRNAQPGQRASQCLMGFTGRQQLVDRRIWRFEAFERQFVRHELNELTPLQLPTCRTRSLRSTILASMRIHAEAPDNGNEPSSEASASVDGEFPEAGVPIPLQCLQHEGISVHYLIVLGSKATDRVQQ